MTVVERNTTQEDTTIQPLIAISETAAGKLQQLMGEKQLDDSYALRVFVAGGGCSGLQYGMTFDNEIHEGDNEFSAHSLRVLVDPVSATYLTGAEVDYVDTLMGGGFKIENPNAVSSCGCGHSFRAEEGEDSEASSGGGCSSCSSY